MIGLTVDQHDHLDLAGRIAATPLLADPDFGSKARKGEKEVTRPCIGCYKFLGRVRGGQALSCAEIPNANDLGCCIIAE
jgi:2,4-dienoyl-CoA reductase-like NADH-dependent reductase (Old Yellow Enzyme family)